MRSEIWAIILAAGSASRFGSLKQFATLAGVRLVDRAIAAASSACDSVVVVLPACSAEVRMPVATTVIGGATRVDSSRCGLAVVPADADIVVVHDAAHPLASKSLFDAVIGEVRRGAAAAVPGLPLLEVLKRVEERRVVESHPKNGLFVVQTPQAFRAEVLRAAHAHAPQAVEDSMLVEALGEPVAVVPGDPANVHVATPRDLEVATRLVDLVD